MGKRDKRFDVYIADAPEFAQPILAKSNAEAAHGQFGRLTSVKELPSKALNTFDAFSPSARKEYIDWITEAKAEATRNRRLEQAIAWMADGKLRHWKYQK